jgi:hypothetical protein
MLLVCTIRMRARLCRYRAMLAGRRGNWFCGFFIRAARDSAVSANLYINNAKLDLPLSSHQFRADRRLKPANRLAENRARRPRSPRHGGKLDAIAPGFLENIA